MINIVHLSDLHFGSNDPSITQKLQSTVIELNPDLVVVSGDLTTRSRSREFISAKEFLDPLPGKRIVVPGNHDISLYNIFRRFIKPLKKFKNIIDKEVDPHLINDEAIIIGLNSSRSFTIKGGHISIRQLEKVRETVKDLPANLLRVVVTHHPMDQMDRDILEELLAMGINVFISGHLHKSGSAMQSFETEGNATQAVFVKAGTATSVRYRDEANSFNFLTIDNSDLTVRTYTWDQPNEQFALVNKKLYPALT